MFTHKSATVYALSTCFKCKALIEFLENHQIDFSVINIDELEGKERRDSFKDVKRFNPKCTFPTLLIRDRIVVGYKKEMIKEILNIKSTSHH